MRKSIAVGSAIVASALALAACSSSSTPSNSAAPSGSATSSAASGVADAQAFLSKYVVNPTTLGGLTPLSKKPATGKFVIGIDNATASAKVLSDAWASGAAKLGWTYKWIDAGYTPETEQKAMDSALALNPNGIMTSGILVSTIQSELATASAKGIPVNTSASTDPSDPKGFYDASIADTNQLTLWGQMIAAQVVVDTNGQAKVQDFSLPVYPILEAFDKAFEAALMKWCPTCSYTENPQQGADIGTNTPNNVVSVMQKNPDTNWLIFDLGDLETGVDAALQAASITGVHIGGLTATVANIQAVKAGKQDAWTGYSEPIVGYRQIDSLARQFNGDPIEQAPLPTQVINKANVATVVLDSVGNYLGLADYQSQFATLWLVN
jgi:ribose transport system substrate-binding protein